MNREDAYSRIDSIIAKYEIDEEYVTITRALDYDALRMARKALEQEPCKNAIGREDMLDAIGHGTTYTSEELQKIIKALPSVNLQPKWIPVSEMLPKEDGDYLVAYEKGYAEDYDLPLIGIVGFEVDCESFGYWYEHFDRQTMGSLGSEWEEIKVIARMPLPAPYEPQERSDKE